MSEQIINLLITGTLDTLQMTIISTVMAMLLGIPLGVVLVVTSKGHILENVTLNKSIGCHCQCNAFCTFHHLDGLLSFRLLVWW